MIEAHNLHRSYQIGKKLVEVLHGIELSIAKGSGFFFVVQAGAGKTTLLYTLAGLERPQQGSISIAGTDLYALNAKKQAAFRNANIGYIFQNYLLLPELTALENVMVPGAIGGSDAAGKAMEALERVGLTGRSDHLPSELSGGEQQRVAIARAVANRPAVLFADEPTGNLDSRNSGEVMDLLLGLAGESGTTLVVVTHDPALANSGDRQLVIKDGTISG